MSKDLEAGLELDVELEVEEPMVYEPTPIEDYVVDDPDIYADPSIGQVFPSYDEPLPYT